MSDHGRPGSPLAVKIETALGGTNLIASRSAPAAGDVLVVAHLDTVSTSPGADDNASGVAVALEFARRFTGSRVNIALVDLEEIRMLGSRHLAGVLPPPVLVVCLDAVGYFSDQPNSQKLPPGFGALFPDLTTRIRSNDRRGDFTLCVHRRDSADFARHWAVTARSLGLGAELLPDPRRSGRFQRLTRWINPLLLDLDRSDHVPFWWRRVPAVVLTNTAVLRSQRYHRSSDTPDVLDYPRMEQLATSLERALDIFSGGPD